MLGKKMQSAPTFGTTISDYYLLEHYDSLTDDEKKNIQKDLFVELYKEKHRGERVSFWEIKRKDETMLSDEANDSFEKKNLLSDEMRECLKGAEGGLIKDAAALCQLTYACDPNRSGDNIYHTDSRNWIPYIPKNENYLSKRVLSLFGNSFDGQLRPSRMQKYSLLEKIGFGTFRAIFTDDDIFDEFDKRISRGRTGFFSMLFFRKVNNETHLAYVTSGTTFNYRDHKYDLLMDNITNIGQALFGLSPQYTLAIQNAKILNKICEMNNGYRLYFFGHSLGGGMAIANALATKRKAIVFNNGGINRKRNLIHGTYWSNEAFWKSDENKNILRIYTRNDWLSTEKNNKHWDKVFTNILGLSPQDVGKKLYFGEGGHGIDDMCRAMSLEFVCNKSQITRGI